MAEPEQKENLESTYERIKQRRDELRVQYNLAKADLREDIEETWEDLEDDWQELQERMERVRESSKDSMGELQESSKSLMQSLRDGYDRIRNQLSSEEQGE